ncbi:MAG: RNA polymerase sigma factor [Spirochaetota bacterium]
MEGAEPIAADRRGDEELAARFCTYGDREALAALVSRYSPRLRRLLYSIVGPDPEAIADAEQEVYVSLIRKIDRFRGHSSFSTFFYSLARHRALDLMRSRGRSAARTVAYEDADRFRSTMAGPETALIAGATGELVRRALARLSPEDRLLVYLKDGEGERVERLAEMVGKPIGTVKSRLARARTRLARYLEETGYEGS